MAICTSDYKLVVTFSNKTQKIVKVQAAHELKLPANAQLALIEVATGKPPNHLRTQRKGKALVIEIEGEGEITQVVDFYGSSATWVEEVTLLPETQQALSSEGNAVAETLICTPAVVSAGSMSPWISGLAGGGGGVFLLNTLASKTPVEATVIARVVAGPVLAGNDLQATIYKADGVSVLGKGPIGADGSVKLTVSGYTGVVIVKVENDGGPGDMDGIADYMDEATGRGTDLDTVLFSAGELIDEGGTIYLNVNILTSVAAITASRIVGPDNSLNAVTVNNTNAAIAQAFGLDDLSSGDVLTTVDITGASSIGSSNAYGQILAALSGADQNNNGNSAVTLNRLLEGISVEGQSASLSPAAMTLLIDGAKAADPGNTQALVDKISDTTTQIKAQLGVASIAGDNVVNLTNMTQGVTLTGSCDSGMAVTLTLGENARAATVNGRTWSYTLTSADFNAMGQGAQTLLLNASGNGQSVAASRGFYIDTLLPSAPVIDALLINDTTPTLTGTANLSVGESLRVSVGGATYTVVPDRNTGQWSLNLETATPISGSRGALVNGQTYQIEAFVTDVGGNQSSDATVDELRIDITPPALTIDEVSGGFVTHAETGLPLSLSGTSSAEDGQVLSVTLGGQTYATTVSAGVWEINVPNTNLQNLGQGTFTVTAQVADAAGNQATPAARTFVQDTIVPAVPAGPSAYADDVGAIQNASSSAISSDDTRPSLRVPTGLVDTPKLYVNGVLTAATYNASAGTLTANSALPDGAHVFTYSLTDAAGNESAPSAALAITVDATAPAVPAAPVAYSDNTGTVLSASNAGGFTDETRPGIRISTNLVDAPKLYVNGVLTPATYNASTGTLTPNSALPEGVQLLTYSLSDAAGNESVQSAALSITVDTTAPSTPTAAPDLPSSGDTGASSSDNITTNNRPALQVGTPLPVGVTHVDLLVNGQVVAATYDSQTGLLQPNAALADGPYSFSYRYTDAAGNQSPASSALSLTIDTAMPVQPSAAADVLSSSDSGASASDNITNNTRPALQVDGLPAGASGVEMLVNGQWVQATYNSLTGVLQANAALPGGTHAISYRYVDTAGNPGAASAALSVTIDTAAPSNAAITLTTAGSIAGTFEVGTALTLTIAGQPAAGAVSVDNANGTWSYVPTAGELTLLRQVGAKELVLTATDVAGNTAQDNRTATADDFSGPYIKEYIPFDGGVLANNANGASATLNVVFSKEVVKGTGLIRLFEVGNPTAVASIDVTTAAVQIDPVTGRDIFITLPALVLTRQYYVTLAAGTFRDLAGESYLGRTQADAAGWDFTAVAASISPNFVAGDDLINTSESGAAVLITGKVVGSSAILEDITAANLTVAVSVPSGQPAVTAGVPSYNASTGEFAFSVPASAWAEGTYGYTVSLAGSSGDAAGINASYVFDSLAVDLTAPTMVASMLGVQDNVGTIVGDIWGTSTSTTSDDTTPTLGGTLSAALSGDARVVVYRQDVTGTPGALERVTGSEGLKPAGTSWSLTDSGLVNGRSYLYTAYVEDAAGNRSTAGTAKTLTIDTTAPLASVSAASLSADTGTSSSDGLTNVANQSISGTLGLGLVGGEKLLGSLNGGVSWQDLTGMVNGTAFSWSGITLQPGQGSIRFKVIDAAGNEGPVATYSTNLDATAPSAPTAAADLSTASDTGVSSTDNNTSNNRPNLAVGALPADVARVELLVNNAVVAATYNSLTGMLRPNAALPDGTHVLVYRHIDAAGNASPVGTALSLTIDTTAPTGVSGLDISVDTGTSDSDFLTNIQVQTVTATLGAPLGAGETVFGSVDPWGVDWTNITSSVTGSALNWTGVSLWDQIPEGLSASDVAIRLQVRDAAGNVGATVAQQYELDMIPPAPTATFSSIGLSADTGTRDDFITNTAAQTVTANLSRALATGETVFGSVDGGLTWVNITSKVTSTSSAIWDGENWISTGTTNTTLSWDGATLSGSSIQLQVRDAAGNAAPAAMQAYTLDTTAPSTTFSGVGLSVDSGTPGDFITNTAAQTISATLSAALAAGETVFGSVDGGSTWVNITNKVTGTALSWDGVMLMGASSIQFQVRDLAGNAGAASVQAYAFVPRVAPVELSIIAAGMGGGFAINGQSAGDSSGNSVASAGDLNGDGFADLIVGAYFSDLGSVVNAGRTYVVWGKPNMAAVNLSEVAAGIGGFVVNGQSAAWDTSGYSVASAGDVNGDGRADLIIGANGSDPASGSSAGRSYVVWGKANMDAVNLSEVAAGIGGFVVNGQSAFDGSGGSVASAGDVNGDGLVDLIIGASGGDPTLATEAGRSYVVFGKTNTNAVNLSAVAAGTGGFVVNGQSARDGSGLSVASAGDVNGDGLADLIIGALWSDPTLATDAGRSYVVFGKTNTNAVNLSAVAAGANGFVINGQSGRDYSGASVASAGDVNGDGLADLIVGAPLSDPAGGADAGRSYVVFGKANGSAIDLSAVAAGTGGFVINGEFVQDTSGASVASAGDVNGDGLADLIVGAKSSDPSRMNSAGRSYVVYGKTGSSAIDLSAVVAGNGGFVINGQSANDFSGVSVASAGDVNGDGLADLIVGAPSSDPNSLSDAGRSYVIFGGTSGPFIDTSVDWLGTSGNDTRSDGGVAQTLVAGAGNDTLTATAAGVLYGGAGDDTFIINNDVISALQNPMGAGGNTTQLARIDGGTGMDTLVLSGASLRLDLTQVANQAASNPSGSSRINGVETIDITGSGNNRLRLNLSDLLDMGSANLFETNGHQQLMVKGNSGDTVEMTDKGNWIKLTAPVVVDGASYHVLDHTTSSAMLYVSQSVTLDYESVVIAVLGPTLRVMGA
jgi:hypothetical protein